MPQISGRETLRVPVPNQRDVVFAADALSAAELDALPFGMIQLDEAGTILRYSTAETRLSGLTSDECVGRSFFTDIAPCTHVAEFFGRFQEGVRAERLDVTFNFHFAFRPPRDVQVRMFYSKATRSVWVRVVDLAAAAAARPSPPMSASFAGRRADGGPRSAPFAPPASAGSPDAVLRELQDARAEADRFRSLFDHHPDAAFALDPAGVLTAVNVACTELTGLAAGQLVGMPFAAVVDPDGRELTGRRIAAVLRGAPHVWDVDVMHANGRRSCTQVTAIPMVVHGAICGVHGIAKDVTIHRVMEEQLAHQAFHDSLTGLANRVLFRERAERALVRAAHASHGAAEHVAVVFLDLDDFKSVNDSLGHAEGDRLLEAVAARLLKATRGCDTVARLGGDEFAVLLDGMAAAEDAAAVVERIAASLRVPVTLAAKEVTVTCSLGLAHARAGEGPDELLRNADVAMYRAKAAGKSRHAVFEPSMHAAVLERVELEADLRRAVPGGELALVYQPLVELHTGRLTGFEALVRWHHPTRGLVGPATFIPLAEDTGLIVEIGRWVLRTACEQLVRWRAVGAVDAGATVSVNVSGRQIDSPGFVEEVRATLHAAGLPPASLTLEITESVIMREPDATLARLHALKALGVSLAIDDFGTGYSSLSYLQRFPVDSLKIDKSFVDGVARGGSEAALARTIVALAEMLRIRSVAEGIERDDQRAQLAALGCQVGQGYLFAKPLAPDEVVRAFGAGRSGA